MKVLNNKFKLNNKYLEANSKHDTYKYSNKAIYESKIWPEMAVSNKEIRNIFIVAFVEKINERLMEIY